MEATCELYPSLTRKGTGRSLSVSLADGLIALVGAFYLATVREGHA